MDKEVILGLVISFWSKRDVKKESQILLSRDCFTLLKALKFKSVVKMFKTKMGTHAIVLFLDDKNIKFIPIHLSQYTCGTAIFI